MTYREVWKEFWSGWFAKEKPYWVPLVENNIDRIVADLGEGETPRTEEEARKLYIDWLDKTDYPQPTQKLTANATVEQNPEMSKSYNQYRHCTPTMSLGTQPQYDKKLWVYNVSRVDHKIDHPMLGDVTIPANTTRKRYSMWTSFPECVVGTNYNIDTNEMYTYPIQGMYFVDDLINPDYMVGGCVTSIGRDLSVKGIFWSYSNPPKPAEVNAAVMKMKSHYVDLLEKIAIVYESSMPNLENVQKEMKNRNCSLAAAVQTLRVRTLSGSISPEHHAAAEYFKVTTPWHPVLKG